MENFTRTDLHIIKQSLRHTMLDLTKDLKKSLKGFDYDEADCDIQVLADYLQTLRKVSRSLKNE